MTALEILRQARPSWQDNRRKSTETDWDWVRRNIDSSFGPVDPNWGKSTNNRRVFVDDIKKGNVKSVSVSCTCDGGMYEQAQAPTGDGSEQQFCMRALQYTRDSNGGLSDRQAFTGQDGPACGPGGDPIDWFFEPDEAQVTDWLNGMTAPPPEGIPLTVSLYFVCTRMVVDDGSGHMTPTSDESGSGVYLTGICYGN